MIGTMGEVGKSGNNAKSVELSKLLSKLKHVTRETKFEFLRINRTMKLINRIVSRSFHTFINKFVHLFKIKSIRFIKFHPSFAYYLLDILFVFEQIDLIIQTDF